MYTPVSIFLLSLLCNLSQAHMIGGIFYEDSDEMKTALEVSAQMKKLEFTIKEVSKRGEFLEITNSVCELAKAGVVGIIDGIGGRGSENVQALCDMLEIPHIMVHHNDIYSSNWTLLSMTPSPEAYNMVLESLIVEKDWRNFTLLYVNGHSLLRMNDLLNMGNSTYPYVVTVRELAGDDYRDVLIDAKQNGYENFVVDCPSRNIEQLLLHAQQVGLMADEYSYIILSPDLFTLDLDRYRYGGVNITGFRLIDLSKPEKLLDFRNKLSEVKFDDLDPEKIKIELLLIHDAVEVLAAALHKLPKVETNKISCENYESWMYGSSLLNFMKTNKVEGITRTLIFDGRGQRVDVTFEMLELTPAGNESVGLWQNKKLNITRPDKLDAEIIENTLLRNKTLKVLISATEPYAFTKQIAENLVDNDRYEGFTIDLIEQLSIMLGFNYIFQVEKDYGTIDKGEWTGMVALLKDEKADLGICDFTITAERQSAIDFSTPFMTTGIGILYKQPSKQPPEMFSFMAVFSNEVWYYMLLIQLILGAVLIFVGRISNKEWQNPVPCIEQPEELSNQFSFANSVWLIIGSVMQQGSEIAPIALAPRLITSVWWFFTMVMVASYVGTLVAFLTIEKNVLPFTNVEELYKLNSMPYTLKLNGSTRTFFKQSTNPVYKSMYSKMLANNWLVKENDIGVERVEKKQYAFFMEATSIEYVTQRHCDLLQVGELLDSKGYGIGMKKKSPYKRLIDDALLKLKERGVIAKLKNIWWNEKRGGGKCGADQNEDMKQLGMKHMLGAFVVLGGGCGVGLIISILDMLWGVFKRSIKYETTFKYELVEELKFAIKFSGNVKPVNRPAKTVEGSAEALAKSEGKDEVRSLRSIKSSKSNSTHRTNHSHSSRHSSLSIAFARRREYT